VSLVSLSTLKEYLPEVQGTGSDTELTNLLERVESACAAFLGFPRPAAGLAGSTGSSLEDRSYTFHIDEPLAGYPYVLAVPVRPLLSVTSFHSDVERVYGSDTEIAASEYDIDTNLGRIIIKDASTATIERGFRANKVVCTAGFSSAPQDLEHAVCVYASMLSRAKQTQGKDSTTQRAVTVKLSPRTMPDEVRDILREYRAYQRVL
jgi:hypothetical protein